MGSVVPLNRRIAESEVGTPIGDALADFERSLRAQARSEKTIRLYADAVGRLQAHLAERGRPTDVGQIARADVEWWMAAENGRVAPSTANLLYRSASRFFGWCEAEGIVETSPMARMHAPKAPAVPVPVLTPEQVQAMLDACRGRDFRSRRDACIIAMLAGLGLRRAELGNLRVDDVDRDQQRVYVVGKGDRGRFVSYGAPVARHIDAYARIRARHPAASSEAFLLGVTRRPFGPSGVGQAVANRAEQAGLGRVHPHQFRHTLAHNWLASGRSETDLMTVTGWTSRQMLSRYGASAASSRAAKIMRERDGLDLLGIKS